MTKFNMPEIKVDTTDIYKAGRNIQQGIAFGNKLSSALQLSSFKMKTIMGEQLPKEDVPVVTELIKRMSLNGWLTQADVEWCYKNNITIQHF